MNLTKTIKSLFFVSLALLLASCEKPQPTATPTLQRITSELTKRDFDTPKQAVVLEITGKISQFNHQSTLVLDRQQLLKFEQVTIETTTPWTDGLTRFKGPLLRDVLAAAGNTGTSIYAKAINEYAVNIPFSDSEKYPVILAIEKNGKELTTRNKGPIWLIYPWSSVEGLNQDKFYSRSIWQLISLSLK